MDGRKSFHCDRCSYESTRTGNLNRHIRVVHKDDTGVLNDTLSEMPFARPSDMPFANDAFNFTPVKELSPKSRSMKLKGMSKMLRQRQLEMQKSTVNSMTALRSQVYWKFSKDPSPYQKMKSK